MASMLELVREIKLRMEKAAKSVKIIGQILDGTASPEVIERAREEERERIYRLRLARERAIGMQFVQDEANKLRLKLALSADLRKKE